MTDYISEIGKIELNFLLSRRVAAKKEDARYAHIMKIKFVMEIISCDQRRNTQFILYSNLPVLLYWLLLSLQYLHSCEND